jgi:hypothetical protein
MVATLKKKTGVTIARLIGAGVTRENVLGAACGGKYGCER